MEFRIADTFTDSLAKLAGDEQKAVKTAAFDLQLNPAHPGLQFHKLERPKDRRFWAIRVSSDVRLIVHRTETSLLLCYVGHHDNAYQWAERRKLETHPKTGAAQLCRSSAPTAGRAYPRRWGAVVRTGVPGRKPMPSVGGGFYLSPNSVLAEQPRDLRPAPPRHLGQVPAQQPFARPPLLAIALLAQ